MPKLAVGSKPVATAKQVAQAKADDNTRTVVKRVKNAVLFSDGAIRIDNVRCSYPHLVTPQAQVNDEGKETTSYSIQLLAPKKTHREAKDLCVEVLTAILLDNKVKGLPADKKFIKNGDDQAKDEQVGQWVINAKESRTRPALRGRKKDPKTGKPMRLDPDKDGDVFYGGCYVSAMIKPWFSSHPKGGKRVSCGLLAVQFLEDGEPFGNARISEDEVDDSFEGEDTDDGGFGEDDEDDL